MHINQAGLNLIKSFEGLRLEAYKDVVGVLTIGYGCTIGVTPGMKVTPQQAEDMLKERLIQFEAGVTKCVKIPLTENEFSALVSFAYNLGLGNLGSSTLLKVLNQGKKQEASEQFVRWNRAGGNVYAGLTRRREAERDLFLRTT